MRLLEVATAPTLRALTVQECKDFLRLTADDENELILALIDAATARCETDAGRSLLTQTRDLKLDDFPSGTKPIELLGPPIVSVTSVSYYDQSNDLQTLTVTTEYLAYCGTNHGRVYLPDGGSWPSTYVRPDAVIVRYVSGWTAAASVPAPVRTWLMQAVATMYEYRESMVTGTIATELPRNFLDGLLDPYRCISYP